MPIVIDRHTGEVIKTPEITKEQKDKAWEIIIRHWCQKHPEVFEESTGIRV